MNTSILYITESCKVLNWKKIVSVASNTVKLRSYQLGTYNII